MTQFDVLQELESQEDMFYNLRNEIAEAQKILKEQEEKKTVKNLVYEVLIDVMDENQKNKG